MMAKDFISQSLRIEAKNSIEPIKGEVSELRSNFEKVLASLSTLVSQRDERLKFQFLISGSNSEGTKSGDPDEFDYLLILTEFKDVCDVVDGDCPPSFVRLKVKTENGDRFSDFVDDKTGLLEAKKIARSIYTKIHACLPVAFLNNTQCSSLCYTKEVTHKLVNVLNFEFEFVSATYKRLTVSVDLVPAVNVAPFVPRGASLPDGELPPLLAIIKTPAEDRSDSTLLRLSFSLIESLMIRRMSRAAREGYKLSKVLRSPMFCPRVYLYQLEGVPLEECTFSAPLLINSYMLKNSLFKVFYKFVAESEGVEKVDGDGHDQDEDDDVIMWGYRIYDQIYSFLMQQCEMKSNLVMQSYLLPTYVKEDTHIAWPLLMVTIITKQLEMYLHSKQMS